ncbi:hypothetical protein [Dactylosporangium sp. CA-233914]|uniref:hypothetical protein n=1 Tax=Dactylosporangium sp. CA-233914 TaxID=3239934 RepID=UPI003D902F6E
MADVELRRSSAVGGELFVRGSRPVRLVTPAHGELTHSIWFVAPFTELILAQLGGRTLR